MEQPPILPGLNYEEIRTAHLHHEASIQSIGTLYYLAGFGSACMALATVLSHESKEMIVKAALVAVFGLFSCAYFWMGKQLKQLNPAVRRPATILACLGLLGFPIGTLINGYILFLLHSAKGKMVFSPEYQEAVLATPDIKYKTTKLVWVLLILVLLMIVLAVTAALTHR